MSLLVRVYLAMTRALIRDVCLIRGEALGNLRRASAELSEALEHELHRRSQEASTRIAAMVADQHASFANRRAAND